MWELWWTRWHWTVLCQCILPFHASIIATNLRTHLHLKLYFYQKNICEEAGELSDKKNAFFISGKIKSALEQTTTATLSLILALDGSGWLTRRPGRFTLGMTQYPFYMRLGGPQGRSGWVRKILLPPGFDPRTVQPVASRYTEYAVPEQISGGYWTEK